MPTTSSDQTFDFIIVGSGIAGLRAAIELEDRGTVLMLTKSVPSESSTEYAQGGIAAAIGEDDRIELHLEDTLTAGAGLCEERAVRVMVAEAPRRIEDLLEWGAAFDYEGGRLALTREAAHSRNRILHAQGDSTGQEISRTLHRRATRASNLVIRDHTFVIDLLCEKHVCRGVSVLCPDGHVGSLFARQGVLLATGGLGHLFRETTNPLVATGDGMALALRAGAHLADMEFVQFHPTALKIPAAPVFLLSEALRGEGAVLRNAAGERFMSRYHPAAELAPRDVVSRAIFQEALSRGESHVLLDATHEGEQFLRARFPRIFGTLERLGLRLDRDWIPVFPAAHYEMGGVLTDLEGRSTVQNLWCAGETACTGVHGANRLASNSLLEGLVFGKRAGSSMTTGWSQPAIRAKPISTVRTHLARHLLSRPALQEVMTGQVGILRTETLLRGALDQLMDSGSNACSGQYGFEDTNLLTVARVVAASALLRTESRGAHYRIDFPNSDDQAWRAHILAAWDEESQELSFSSCRRWQN